MGLSHSLSVFLSSGGPVSPLALGLSAGGGGGVDSWLLSPARSLDVRLLRAKCQWVLPTVSLFHKSRVPVLV